MAHSKRNTSLPHFTSYERSLLRSTWGTQRTRLSRESFLPFSSCRLCLLPARAPVVACATNGDIFCRECAVNDLLAQRKEIKRLEKERELAERDKEEGEGRLAEEARERELREFEMVSMGLEQRKRKLDAERDWGGGGDGSPNGELARKRRKGFELDEETMRNIAQEEREKVRREIEREKSESSKSQLPSFWVPSLTPSTSNSPHDAKPVKLAPLCPASTPENKHNYSLKGLVNVNFTEDKDDQSGETIRICPSCKKGLSNGVKAILTKPCGHVICKPCVDKFMTPHQTPDPHDTDRKDKEMHGRVLCYVCETDVTERRAIKEPKEGKKDKDKDKIRPGLVTINSEGTGFAGGGVNMAKKAGTAFQC
ncbi:hypothetical protein AJ78_03103 [Emergomyces pasteurianus Ep9510]|uniref:RING-type domain-containing protein n=1 Tax=Emergomyces pasteurianus Ep9510 TaxID=1447872 RepID=A0A1J9QND9_9EURO|nr:hypothetical protein AJ78_03103 [Emergomyces pasteurianus Ep9510]